MAIELPAVAESSTLKQERVQLDSTLVIVLAHGHNFGTYNLLCLGDLPCYERLSLQTNLAEIRWLSCSQN